MRLYTVIANNVTVANQAVTLVQILAPIGTQISPVRVHVGQTGSATSAMQRVQVHRKASAYSTVTSQTPQVIEGNLTQASLCVGGAAATGVNASAEGAGTETVLWIATFNVLSGWDWILTEREREAYSIGTATAQALSIKFPTAPATLGNWHCSVEFEET